MFFWGRNSLHNPEELGVSIFCFLCLCISSPLSWGSTVLKRGHFKICTCKCDKFDTWQKNEEKWFLKNAITQLHGEAHIRDSQHPGRKSIYCQKNEQKSSESIFKIWFFDELHEHLYCRLFLSSSRSYKFEFRSLNWSKVPKISSLERLIIALLHQFSKKSHLVSLGTFEINHGCFFSSKAA